MPQAKSTNAILMPAALLVFAGALLAPPSTAQVQDEVELAPIPDIAGARFGHAAVLRNFELVVGARRSDVHGDEAGTVYLFEEPSQGAGWVLQKELVQQPPAPGDSYGTAIARSSSYIAIGAPNEDGAGAVHMWQKSSGNWIYHSKLVAPDPEFGDRFGFSLVIDNSSERLLVGAPFDDDGGLNSGSVYAFNRSGGSWGSGYKLTPSLHSEGDLFGSSLSMVGTNYNDPLYAVIGAPGRDDSGADSGAAFVFYATSISQFYEVSTLAPNDPSAGQQFGKTVDLYQDPLLAFVGAPGDAHAGTDSGAVYVFRYESGSWPQERKLTAPDAEAGDMFGMSLLMREDELLVGAPFEDTAASDGGALYTFGRIAATWIPLHQAWDPNASATAYFGRSITATTDRVAIGSPGDDTEAEDAGSLSTFELLSAYAPILEQRLTAGEEDACNDRFGQVVDLAGTFAVVGSPGDSRGTVTVFDGSSGTWEFDAKLGPTTTDSNPGYGASFAVHGERLVVGAAYEAPGGFAYFYSRSGGQWIEDAHLTAASTLDFDGFGTAVDIDGDDALVGSTGADGAMVDSGAAFLFQHDGASWSEVGRLDASDGQSWDSFGSLVAIQGDLAAVAKPYPTTTPAAAYVYRRTGGVWSEEVKITIGTGGGENVTSVAVDGNTVAIGVPFSSVSQVGTVHVWVWDGANWSEEQQVVPDDSVPFDSFGMSLDLQGDVLVVGGTPPPDQIGAVYEFLRSAGVWTQQEKWVPDVLETGSGFATSIAVDASLVIAGAPYHGGSCASFQTEGRAWVASLEDELGTVYCDETQNPENEADLAIDTLDSGATSINLTLSNGPPGQFGYLLVGDGTATVSAPPGAVGDLCVAGGSCLGRYDKDAGAIDSGGLYSVDIKNAISNPCDGAVTIAPGWTWNFQMWHRQPMGDPSTFSSALSVTFE